MLYYTKIAEKSSFMAERKAGADEKRVSPSLEDYLEAIYFIQRENGSARVTDVSDRMGISKPSVNRAINTLKKQEYVEHEPYGTLTLTAEGLKTAKSVAERHYAIKRFLVLIGVSDEDAENEACRLEHAMSAETVLKLKAYLADNK